MVCSTNHDSRKVQIQFLKNPYASKRGNDGGGHGKFNVNAAKHLSWNFGKRHIFQLIIKSAKHASYFSPYSWNTVRMKFFLLKKHAWLSWRWKYNLLLFNRSAFSLQCIAEIQLDQLMCIFMPRKNCWSHSMSDFVLVIQKIDFWVLGDGYPSMWILRCAPSLVSCKNSVTTCNVKCDVLPWSNDVMDGKINIKSSFVFTDYLL